MTDDLEPTQPDEGHDVEAIMAQVRLEILARKGGRAAGIAARLSSGPRRLPAEFYDHLYQAGLLYDQVDARLHVTPVNIPLAGPLVQWLRRQVHGLVIHYVNQVARQHLAVNIHLLEALSILAQVIEAEEERP